MAAPHPKEATCATVWPVWPVGAVLLLTNNQPHGPQAPGGKEQAGHHEKQRLAEVPTGVSGQDADQSSDPM